MFTSPIAPTSLRRVPNRARTLKKAVKVNFRPAKAKPSIASMFLQLSKTSYVGPNFSKVVTDLDIIINYQFPKKCTCTPGSVGPFAMLAMI